MPEGVASAGRWAVILYSLDWRDFPICSCCKQELLVCVKHPVESSACGYGDFDEDGD